MTKEQKDELREEFYNRCDNDNSGLQRISRVGTDLISKWWLLKFDELLNEKAEAVEKLKFIEVRPDSWELKTKDSLETTSTFTAKWNNEIVSKAVDIIRGVKS